MSKTPKLAQFHILKPSPNQPLPPRIKPSVSSQVFSPRLPNLPHNPTPEITTDLGKDSLAKTLTIHPIDLKKLVIKPINNTFPYLRRLKVKPVKEETVNNKLDTEEIPTLKKSPQLPAAVPSSAKTSELPADDPQQTEDFVINDISYAELIAEIVAGVIKSEELDMVDTQENSLILNDEELDVVDTQENSLILNDKELHVVDTQENSPLLQKWMQSQGYLLTESVATEAVATEAVAEESSDNDIGEETQPVDVELLLNQEIEPQEDPVADNIPLETNKPEIVNLLSPIPNQPTWLSQEIVIDDLVIELDSDSLSGEAIEDDSYSPSLEDETRTDLSPVIIESLPTPQLYLPEGELVAGTSVVVRVELSEISSSVAVKLWVEDYQTRSLLDGPHILSDLRSNAWGGGETAIYLKIPFGCLEIRLAAIALNQTTQQESNKVTVIKTVIPPDLPTIELDEMLGM